MAFSLSSCSTRTCGDSRPRKRPAGATKACCRCVTTAAVIIIEPECGRCDRGTNRERSVHRVMAPMTTPGSRFLILAVKASEPQSLSKTLPRERRDPLANRFNGHQEVLDY